MPFETCREVPDVDCFTILKQKPEIECTPEPYEECNDVAKEIPYLEPGEECEEIVYDECVTVRFIDILPYFILIKRLKRKFPLSCARENVLMRNPYFFLKDKCLGRKERREGKRLATETHLMVGHD